MNEDVIEISREEAYRRLSGKVPPDVLEVATQEPALYWLDGEKVLLDDPFFGDPVYIEDLAYDSVLGLHRKSKE